MMAIEFCCVVSMLQSAKNAEELSAMSRNGQQLLQQLEDSPKPVVAAISGTALGGGLEVGFLV